MRCGTVEGDSVWCNATDTPGLIMATVAWIVMLFCAFAFSFLILEFSWAAAGITVVALYNVLVVLSLWAHIKTMTTDPGSVPHCSRPLASAREAGIPETICGRCDAYKPPRSHHCRICNRCIIRMDHHCPWMNNCIGAGNQKHFILFLVYTWAQCTSALVMLVVRLSTCEHSASDCFPGVEGHLAVSMAVFSILALIFVTSMLYNQTYAVLTGIGTIDRMKRHSRHVNHKPVRWVDVFGNDMWLWWLLPTDMTFERHQEVFGYTTQKTKSTSWSIHDEDGQDGEQHAPVLGDEEPVEPPSDSADAADAGEGQEDESVPGEEKVPLNAV